MFKKDLVTELLERAEKDGIVELYRKLIVPVEQYIMRQIREREDLFEYTINYTKELEKDVQLYFLAGTPFTLKPEGKTVMEVITANVRSMLEVLEKFDEKIAQEEVSESVKEDLKRDLYSTIHWTVSAIYGQLEQVTEGEFIGVITGEVKIQTPNSGIILPN